MRFWSTPQSAQAGEVTVLAILETVAATAVSVWLVVHRGTLKHVVIGACLAPFLLMRTEEATEIAFKWTERFILWINIEETSPGWRSVCLAILLPLMRPASIILTVIRHPLRSLRSIPYNWNLVILATDFHHPPEILAGVETRNFVLADLRFKNYIRDVIPELIEDQISLSGYILTVVKFIVFAVLCTIWFLPALTYRYSLKATAIAYLPIIWILHDGFVDASKFQRKLEDILTAQSERFKRWYSGFVILFLVIGPAVVYFMFNQWWQQLTGWLKAGNPAVLVLLSPFLPTEPNGLNVRGWHLFRGVNAVLTFLLLFWADGKMRQIRRGELQKTDGAVAVLNLWLLVRWILTFYIIGCTLFIIVTAMHWKDFWPIHFQWWPWR